MMAVAPLTLVEVASGFRNPVVATSAADASGRLFVAEQGGLVHIVRNGVRDGVPFLDLRSDLIGGGASGERGLLGFAFHPQYATIGSEGEGTFYVYFSAPGESGDHDSVIAEYRVSANDPDLADLQSKRTILRFNQPFSNHNGGDLKFGPHDGFLYISSGDGGSGGDPLGHGQNPNTLLGAILRIDVGTDDFPADETRNYAIPSNNPFVSNNNARDEIFALGLRNPFRMSFDFSPEGASRLFVGDVGQSGFEEVNLVEAGKNYGWNICEGSHLFQNTTGICPANFEAPIAEYGREEGFSVIGGFVYRGNRFDDLKGVYLFGDFNGTLMALEEQADGTFDRSKPAIVGKAASSIIGFGEDEAGELYVLTGNEVLSIQVDGVVGNDVYQARGSGELIDLAQQPEFQRYTTIDIRGEGANELRLNFESFMASNLRRVIHDEDDRVDFGLGWKSEEPIIDGTQTKEFVHVISQQSKTIEVVNSRPFQNPLEPADVGRDGAVSARDALTVINALPLFSQLPTVLDTLIRPHAYIDVSGDNQLSARDALIVINRLPFEQTGIENLERSFQKLLAGPIDHWMRQYAIERENPSESLSMLF